MAKVIEETRELLHRSSHYSIYKTGPMKIEIEGTADYSTAETMAYWMTDYGKMDCDGDRCNNTACHWSATVEMLWCDELAEKILGKDSELTDEEVAKRFRLSKEIVLDERYNYRD